MGKSDEKQTDKRAHKATDDGESKHKKNKPSFDTLGSSPFATTLEAIDDEGVLHSKWRDFFRQLCEYKVQFGDCIVPQQYAANPNLGTWVRCQRTRFRESWDCEEKSDSVTAEHLRALESIGFNLGIGKTDFAPVWSLRFQQMCEFKAQFGHFNVPYEYTANLKLGRWVSSQRGTYRLHQNGMPSSMTAERIRELENVGFEWGRGKNKTSLKCSWNERFEQLREFKVQFGHCLVPHRYTTNRNLGIWVSNQRAQYRLQQEGKPSRMTAEHIRELENIGFEWWISKAIPWSERFQQLCEFKVEFGHCVVPCKYSANPTLGKWVSKQRHYCKLYHEGKTSQLTEERIRALESVDF
jgi:hypothetical protein